jgi:hypothetical protein
MPGKQTYKFLNPVGIIDPVQQYPLSKRLDTIEGKNIFFSIGAGGEQDIIIPLRKKLVEKYPKTNWHFYMAAAHATVAGSSALSEEDMKIADGLIRGVVW